MAYREIVAANDQRIVTRSADGQGGVEQVYAPRTGAAVPYDWSPDGSALAISDRLILVLHIASKRVDTVSAGEGPARFSPNGRWLPYVSSQTGRPEIYVKPYPSLASTQQFSANCGRFPLWSARRGELFFVAGDTMMASVVSTRSGFEWTTPKPLFSSPDIGSLEYPMSVSRTVSAFSCQPETTTARPGRFTSS